MAPFISSLFLRRLKLYGFGLGLGLVLSYAFFGDRYPTWLPGSIIMEELNRGAITYSERSKCMMECGNITTEAIDDLLAGGDVNFGDSDVHREPCPSYVIEGETKAGRELRLVFAKCDSVAELTSAENVDAAGACNCP